MAETLSDSDRVTIITIVTALMNNILVKEGCTLEDAKQMLSEIFCTAMDEIAANNDDHVTKGLIDSIVAKAPLASREFLAFKTKMDGFSWQK